MSGLELSSNSARMLSCIEPSGDITFLADNRPFLTMHKDGRLTIGEHVKPDEAASMFLKTLAEIFPNYFKNLN